VVEALVIENLDPIDDEIAILQTGLRLDYPLLERLLGRRIRGATDSASALRRSSSEVC
jgi:hypothetical protein